MLLPANSTVVRCNLIKEKVTLPAEVTENDIEEDIDYDAIRDMLSSRTGFFFCVV